MSKFSIKLKDSSANSSIPSTQMPPKPNLNHLLAFNVWCKIILNYYQTVIKLVLPVFLKDIASQLLKMILSLPLKNINKDSVAKELLTVKLIYTSTTDIFYDSVELKYKKENLWLLEDLNYQCFPWSLSLLSLQHAWLYFAINLGTYAKGQKT